MHGLRRPSAFFACSARARGCPSPAGCAAPLTKSNIIKCVLDVSCARAEREGGGGGCVDRIGRIGVRRERGTCQPAEQLGLVPVLNRGGGASSWGGGRANGQRRTAAWGLAHLGLELEPDSLDQRDELVNVSKSARHLSNLERSPASERAKATRAASQLRSRAASVRSPSARSLTRSVPSPVRGQPDKSRVVLKGWRFIKLLTGRAGPSWPPSRS